MSSTERGSFRGDLVGFGVDSHRHVECVTETGIALRSVEHLEADIFLTATGLNVVMSDNIALTVDGVSIDVSKTIADKGMMLSGVPSFVVVVGHVNAPWTVRVGLVSQHFCRLMADIDARELDTFLPQAEDVGPTGPLVDLTAG